MQPIQRQFDSSRSVPRRTIRSYPTYAEASRAVDYLSDQKFPVERVAIVAEGLRLVEQVTGRLDWGRALVNGALSGASLGLFVGLFLSLFTLGGAPGVSPLSLAFTALIYGGVFGAILGLVTYALSGGRRDFTSVGGMQAERYNVMVDEEVSGEAETLLEGMR